MSYLPEKTIKYKTYVKTAMVEALKPVFQDHVDKNLQNTNVTIEYSKERQSFPSVIVKFYESEIYNAGVGHEEHIESDSGQIWKFKHYMYKGSIEFMIYALSALDRDLISDTLVQTIAMGNLSAYTNNFFHRIYPPDSAEVPDSAGHFININSDVITGFGESSTNVPWNAEDELLYTISYRVDVWGEFYSLPPDMPYPYVSEVFAYPYTTGEERPLGIDKTDTDWY
jgi:hypothetical protein